MNSDFLEAIRVFDIEARAIENLKNHSQETFSKVCDLLMSCTGKVVVTGIGKSGIIARKIAATLSSTGTPAMYVHPAESSHGDLGMIAKGDVVLALSYSGESVELANVISYCVRKDIPLIGMTGKPASSLGKASSVVLNVFVSEEACPLGLAPTASTTATLAMGDAIAMALLKRRGFKPEDFAEYHPSGSLGARLLTRVKDLMHTGDALALVKTTDTMKKVINHMTAKEVRGIAGVLDSSGHLVGVITDGDLRRRLDKSENPLEGVAQDIMSAHPKRIDASELAEKALTLMEKHNIQSLFVTESQDPNKPVGVLHLQDLLKSKIR